VVEVVAAVAAAVVLTMVVHAKTERSPVQTPEIWWGRQIKNTSAKKSYKKLATTLIQNSFFSTHFSFSNACVHLCRLHPEGL
jgi:hypothetical protein